MISRRDLLVTGSAAAILVTGIGSLAWAEAVDGLKIVAPAAPGGGWDQTARAMQDSLQAAGLASGVEVTNIPGAGGTVGLADFVGRSGDGKSLMVSGLVMVGAILTNKSPVTLDQVTPLARLTGEYEVLVVPAASELKTLADLTAKLKADPGIGILGGGSAGGTDHILAGLIAKAVGADLTKLNYIAFSGGGEALAAILGGHVTCGISGIGEFEGQIAAGELRALAISGPERLPNSQIPTLKEQGVDVELANWRGVLGAPDLSEADRASLIALLDGMAKSDPWKKTLETKGWMDIYQSGDDFAAFVKNESTRIAGVLKDIGLVE